MTAVVPAGPVVDATGADLHPGSVVVQALPDGTVETHTIHHLREYPGPFKGDNARRAYEHDDEHGWCRTVADHELFHIAAEGEAR